MFILKIPSNTVYRIAGDTLFELMDKLANEFLSSQRPTDGYEEYLEAVWPTDPADVDEDYEYPIPVEITEESVQAFAAKVWDTPVSNIRLVEESKPLKRGEFQALMHHMGLGHETLGAILGVAGKTVSRWIAGAADRPIPAGVTGEMRELLAQHDADVERFRELDARGAIIIYPHDESEQQLENVPLGWERRVLQRAIVEHGISLCHMDERV